MYIITRESKNKNLKGKGIVEFGRNLEKEGWPSEFLSSEQKERIKYVENKLGRPLRKTDLPKPSPLSPIGKLPKGYDVRKANEADLKRRKYV